MAAGTRVVGVFDRPDRATAGIRRLRAAGFRRLAARSPLNSPEIEAALQKGASPVRAFTLIGGVAGGVAGFALTVGTALAWPIVTGGKPIVSIPPFLVIAFELTILFAAVGTVLGFLVSARLPRVPPARADDPRFMEDRFAVVVTCGPDETARAREALETAGAEEIIVDDGVE